MTAPNPVDFKHQVDYKQHVAGVFGRSAPTYDQIGPRFFAHFGRRLVALTHLAPGASVLDVATGRGALLFPAAKQVGPAGHVVGIDLAEGMVAETAAELRARRVTNAEVRPMDGEQLDFPQASFDAVLCGFALFFFRDTERALAEFWRVLKPGGRLAVSTWGQDDERWAWLEDIRRKYAPPQFQGPRPAGVAFNQPEAMRAAVAGAGFTEVQVVEEASDFVYADEHEWLAVQWSHGMRAQLEMMTPADREAARADAFAHLRGMRGPDGIPHRLYALGTLGVKS